MEIFWVTQTRWLFLRMFDVRQPAAVRSGVSGEVRIERKFVISVRYSTLL